MALTEFFDGISCFSMRSAVIALRQPSQLRRYISHCLKTYDESVGNGLPSRSPVTPAEDMTVTIPAYHSGGGMSFDELVFIARTVKVLKPRVIFEMGSYKGLTTSVFILNSDPETQVLTLDLPSNVAETPVLSSDQELVADRSLVSTTKALGLSRYTQLLCDSMKFDATPYADTVDLGLVDAAHDLVHVQNDTVKMAEMMSDRGLVFWHDYGGKGPLRQLARYLEQLARKCPLYRIRGTSLAWGHARELKVALGHEQKARLSPAA
jgi:methyltransferase family protein